MSALKKVCQRDTHHIGFYVNETVLNHLRNTYQLSLNFQNQHVPQIYVPGLDWLEVSYYNQLLKMIEPFKTILEPKSSLNGMMNWSKH